MYFCECKNKQFWIEYVIILYRMINMELFFSQTLTEVRALQFPAAFCKANVLEVSLFVFCCLYCWVFCSGGGLGGGVRETSQLGNPKDEQYF